MGSASGSLRLRISTSSVKLNKIARQKPSGQWISNSDKSPRSRPILRIWSCPHGPAIALSSAAPQPGSQRQTRVLRETAHLYVTPNLYFNDFAEKILMHAEKTYGQADVFVGIMRVR